MGKALLKQCTQLWIISPRISAGMSQEIHLAQCLNIPVLVFTAAGFRRYSNDFFHRIRNAPYLRDGGFV